MDKKWVIMDEKSIVMNGFHSWSMDSATWDILFYDRLIPIIRIYDLSNLYWGWLLNVICENIG